MKVIVRLWLLDYIVPNRCFSGDKLFHGLEVCQYVKVLPLGTFPTSYVGVWY